MDQNGSEIIKCDSIARLSPNSPVVDALLGVLDRGEDRKVKSTSPKCSEAGN